MAEGTLNQVTSRKLLALMKVRCGATRQTGQLEDWHQARLPHASAASRQVPLTIESSSAVEPTTPPHADALGCPSPGSPQSGEVGARARGCQADSQSWG